MGIIKGQNLRFLLNNKCIAAALTGSIQINLSVADISTKDSDNSWVENEPMGHNWSGSADALVTDGIYESAENVTATTEITTGIYESSRSFNLQPGQTIHISAASGVNVSLNNSHSSPLVPLSGNTAEYTNSSNAMMVIYLLCDTDGAPMAVYVTDTKRAACAELLQAAKAGTVLDVKFSITTGRNNVVEDENLVTGKAIISSLQLSAANREMAKYQCQFTGVGELSLPEEEE